VSGAEHQVVFLYANAIRFHGRNIIGREYPAGERPGDIAATWRADARWN
jgi:hypothetical protein